MEGKPAANLVSALPWTLSPPSTFCAEFFFERETVTAFSSLSVCYPALSAHTLSANPLTSYRSLGPSGHEINEKSGKRLLGHGVPAAAPKRVE